MRNVSIIIITFFLFLFVSIPVSTFAATGIIDATYKYAWGENIGWINFAPPNGNVTVSDTALIGYAWSENYGWINLSPSIAGVQNDGMGNLSGNAWGEGIGWIDFSGVKINAQGEFTGYALTSQNHKRISFNCINTNSCGSSDFAVKTTWKPTLTPSLSNLTISVSLEGKKVSIVGTPITFIVFTPNTTIERVRYTGILNNTGQLLIPSLTLASGVYDVKILSPSYLAKKQVNLSLSSNATFTFPTLLAGDFNNDAVINNFDWSIMSANWFTQNPTTDINQDGITNSIDYSYLNRNWNRVGE